MNERLIKYDTAKLAKEKGCNLFELDYGLKQFLNNKGITQSALAKWLRDVYNIIVVSQPNCVSKFANKENLKYHPVFYTYSEIRGRFVLYNDFIMGDECTDEMQENTPIFQNYDSYEEALEVGLFECLLTIK
jgi:hypothetical protein